MREGTCTTCGAAIMYARTPKGRLIALDPVRRDRHDATANVALYTDHLRRLQARVLARGEQPAMHEWRALPHAAICRTTTHDPCTTTPATAAADRTLR